jgi:hypothetical protein
LEYSDTFPGHPPRRYADERPVRRKAAVKILSTTIGRGTSAAELMEFLKKRYEIKDNYRTRRLREYGRAYELES